MFTKIMEMLKHFEKFMNDGLNVASKADPEAFMRMSMVAMNMV